MESNESKDQFNNESNSAETQGSTSKVPEWSALDKIRIQLDAKKACRGGRGTRTTRGYYPTG